MKKETLEEYCNKYYEDSIDNSNIEREHYEQEIKDLMIGFANQFEQVSKFDGILLGLKICKEMFAQGQLTHESIYEREAYYKELKENI